MASMCSGTCLSSTCLSGTCLSTCSSMCPGTYSSTFLCHFSFVLCPLSFVLCPLSCWGFCPNWMWFSSLFSRLVSQFLTYIHLEMLSHLKTYSFANSMLVNWHCQYLRSGSEDMEHQRRHQLSCTATDHLLFRRRYLKGIILPKNRTFSETAVSAIMEGHTQMWHKSK